MATATLANLLAALIGSFPIFAPLEFGSEAGQRVSVARPAARGAPGAGEVERAREFARTREGLVSFAMIDGRGRLRGFESALAYPSASVVKAMVLAAELQRRAALGEPLDAATRGLLRAMIRFSDNDAADSIYSRVGDAGLIAIADLAGMRGFTVAGHWGNAQVTAADMARLFGLLDRVFPARHRRYGQRLLGSVAQAQSWGIVAAAGDCWGVRFKGGWLPDRALVHQAAELRQRHGPSEIAVAVLTDQQPSFAYGAATVRGVAARLLSAPRRPTAGRQADRCRL